MAISLQGSALCTCKFIAENNITNIKFSSRLFYSYQE